MSSLRCRSGGIVMGKYIQPVEQVFPEPALPDLFLQVPVGGRYDPHIDLDGLWAAQPFEFSVLDDPKQLGLKFHRHLADLVEEQGAVVGKFEAPHLPFMGAGECALFPPEELAFDEVRRERRAVDRYHRPLLAAAHAVNGARYYSLPRAGLAKEEHGRVLGRHLFDAEEYMLKSIASPDDLADVDTPCRSLYEGRCSQPGTGPLTA